MSEMIAEYAGPAALVIVGLWFGVTMLDIKSVYDDNPGRRIRGTVRAWRQLRRGLHRAWRSRHDYGGD